MPEHEVSDAARGERLALFAKEMPRARLRVVGIDTLLSSGGLVVPSFTSAAAIVSTDFVATLPASLVEVLGERLGVRAVAAPVRGPTVAIKLCWHERTEHDPAMGALRDLIVRAAPSRVRSSDVRERR